jgi:hypothetical protein
MSGSITDVPGIEVVEGHEAQMKKGAAPALSGGDGAVLSYDISL